LAFDVTWVNRLAAILHHGETQYVDFAGLRIDFDIGDVHRECAARPRRIDARAANNRAAVLLHFRRDFPKHHLFRRILLGHNGAVVVLHFIRFDFPYVGNAFAHLPLDVYGRFVGSPAGGVGDAAAAGYVGVADGVGIGAAGAHVFGAKAERFGKLHGDGGAGAADVGRAFDQAHGAIAVDAGGNGGFEADVEPEARADAAATLEAGIRARRQRCRVMRML